MYKAIKNKTIYFIKKSSVILLIILILISDIIPTFSNNLDQFKKIEIENSCFVSKNTQVEIKKPKKKKQQKRRKYKKGNSSHTCPAF